MSLSKASLGNSASFQISGTPFVYEVAGNAAKTVTFKYVTRAIVIQSTVACTISLGDSGSNGAGGSGPTNFTMIANQIYRFEVKTKKIILTPGSSGTVSVVAEMTNVEDDQVSQHTQADWATVT